MKIVDEKIYVLGRDQITRLHDLNGDGEADYYENFCSKWNISPSYHAFSFDLWTDKDGNFKISGAPNGKYTIEAYHPKTHRDGPGVSKEINVNGDTKVDFTIELK